MYLCYYRHLQEHLDEVADGAKIETEDDVYFGYFNVHDKDKDGKQYQDGIMLHLHT